jgi:hypothetical protein
MREKLQGFDATILRKGNPSILRLPQIKMLAADWDVS